MSGQIRRYGIYLLPIWLRLFHYVDIGHFLWVRPVEYVRKPLLPWWSALFANIGIAVIAMLRAQRMQPQLLLYAAVSYTVLLGVRHLSMLAAAKRANLSVEYRAWETGFVISTLMAVGLGGVFLIPGSVYPEDHNWSMRETKNKLAKIAMASIITVLTLATLSTVYLNISTSSQQFYPFIQFLRNAIVSFALFDVLLVFFPFHVFNGHRVWDTNRGLWISFALWTILLYFL